MLPLANWRSKIMLVQLEKTLLLPAVKEVVKIMIGGKRE